MEPAAVAGLCLALATGALSTRPPGLVCPPAPVRVVILDGKRLAAAVAAPSARDAIARVALAEAGSQSDSGLAGVVYTILNRLADGRWGDQVDAVLDASHQFEPVMRAGGTWRALPIAKPADQARVDTILNLALEGRLPDLTQGARYFQNPAIVAARARARRVAARLIDFGGQVPTITIGAHAFFVGADGRGPVRRDAPRPTAGALFFGEVGAEPVGGKVEGEPQPSAASPRSSGDPGREVFVGRDGVTSADPQ